MTTEEIKLGFIDEIGNWEEETGESFTDRFMHDNVKDLSWAFWLLGKGYTEHALEIIKEIEAGNTCIDQDVLYDIYPDWEDQDKNIEIWAEFLAATPSYVERTRKFFVRHQEED